MSKIDFSSIGSVAGGVIGGIFGGPAGAAAGQAIGNVAGQAIEGGNSPKGGAAASTSSASSGSSSFLPGGCIPPSTSGPCTQQSPVGLETNGRNTIDTGRYLIEFKDGEVTITDKLTNTTSRAWGDPHLTTGDGDKLQFQQDLRMELEDGTVIEFDVTEKDANGVALIRDVSVMKGTQAVRVTGLDGQAGFNMGAVLNNAQQVDQLINTRTSIVAGHQVDDWTFKNSGEELVGGDPTAKFGERLIDDGDIPAAATKPAQPTGAAEGTDATGKAGGAQDPGDIQITPGMSIQQILFALIRMLEKTMRSKAMDLSSKTNAFNEEKSKPAGERTVQEGTLQELKDDVQSLAQLRQQFTELASNLTKQEGETARNTIQNTGK